MNESQISTVTRKGKPDAEKVGKVSTIKRNGTDNKAKKPEQLKFATIEKDLCDWIDGRPLILAPKIPPFAADFGVWRPEKGDPQPVQFDHLQRIIRLVNIEDVAAALSRRVSDFRGEADPYKISFRKCTEVVNRWLYTSDRILKDWPKAVCFHSDPSPCFSRLQFDPAPQFSESDFPRWREILSRMTNPEAFCCFLASVVRPKSSRNKQVVWLWGDSNSGKSYILNNPVTKLCGGKLGTATFSGEALTGAHWKEPLVGKSLLVVNEASSSFLRKEAFKSLTGDEFHMINPKGKTMFQGKIDCRIFFSSNEAPEIPNDDAIKNRLIVCKMSAVPRKDYLPVEQLNAEMDKELPYFIAYCLDLYSKMTGDEISSDQEGLEEAIDTFESELQYTFDRVFIYDPESSVTAFQFSNHLTPLVDLRMGISLPKMRAFIASRYGITCGKVERYGGGIHRLYRGIKLRPGLA